MNTKFLMTTSAVFLMLTGIGFSFLPEEIAVLTGVTANVLTIILIQTAGALYFGFGLLNYSARGAMIGGIYNKPIALGNFAHFLIGSLAIIKLLMAHTQLGPIFYAFGFIYVVFAGVFGFINFRHPRLVSNSSSFPKV